MKQIWSRVKHYLHWLMLGGMLFFFTKALRHHWEEVAAIRIDGGGWANLAIAITVSLLAFAWSGLVWGWTLEEFKQRLNTSWLVKVYLKTHIAKDVPGHVWHYYGRIWSAKQAGVSVDIATLSVVIEPFLMISAALLTAIISSQLCGEVSQNSYYRGLLVVGLIAVLMIVHPRFINPILQLIAKLKGKKKGCPLVKGTAFKLQRYPIKLLLGALGFVALRGGGFLLTFIALHPVDMFQLPMLINTFSLAWLAALVLPGAPGGVGVFEATAIALLNQSYSTGLVLSAVAVFRLVTILAEAIGAGLAWLDDRRFSQKYNLDSTATAGELVQIE